MKRRRLLESLPLAGLLHMKREESRPEARLSKKRRSQPEAGSPILRFRV
jgi:hypothetical protein